MTRRKQGQRVLWEGMIDEDVRALWEPWMVQADRLLDDGELIDRGTSTAPPRADPKRLPR